MSRGFSPGERRLRAFFRRLNPFMLWMWGIGDGRLLNIWPAVVGRFLVLHHTGRRTGRRRRTPLNYSAHRDEVFCTAGFGARADWFRNVREDPRVEVWLPGRRWAGVAEDASQAPDRVERLRQVLIASGFAAYMAGLNPRRMSDGEVARLLDDYRLIRLRPAPA